MAPLGVAEAPHHLPGWRAAGAVLALALLGTAAAQLAWFRLLAGWGSSRASLVTYLLPATALVYGIVLLGEPVTIAEIGGLALILAGVALGAGVLRWSRAPAVTQAP